MRTTLSYFIIFFKRINEKVSALKFPLLPLVSCGD